MKYFYHNLKLGVLGGGQLGRMLIRSAIDCNVYTKVLDPSPDAPCKHVASEFVNGSLTDFYTVYNFGKGLDVLTIEIENVNTEALKKLEKEGVKVYPQPAVIEIIQDKRVQKQFYKDNDIPTSPFVLIDKKEELNDHLDFLPAVQKLGKEGYDGRGVQAIKVPSDIEKGFEAPSLLEKFVDFEKELAVIVGRNASGQVEVFPVVELVFHPEKYLVEYLFSPANISEDVNRQVQEIATKVVDKLGIVGILAIEFFLTKDGKVLVNEVAPRPHNSGHQTIEGNVTSQYEQHLRAILDLPLGDGDVLAPSAMINLLGEEGHVGEAKYQGLDEILAVKGVHLHLYGKKQTKPFRKMGHVTITGTDLDIVKKNADFVKETLKVISM